jgi:uncharacterized surface anchored protein
VSKDTARSCGVTAYLPQPWPVSTAWVPLVDTNWTPFRTVSREVTPLWVDISSAGRAGRVGTANSAYLAYIASPRTLFFRLLLSDNPRDATGLYRAAQWGVVIDTSGDGLTDWGATVSGLASAPQLVRVMYSQGLTPEHLLDVTVWSAAADPAAGFTRVTNGPTTPDGRATYYLDWQAPLEVFASADLTAPPGLGPKSCARFFLATGTSEVRFDKDFITGTSINYTPVNPNCVDGLPTGRLGRLCDTRDPDPPSDLGQWYVGDTVTVSGRGWPLNVTSLNVKCVTPTLNAVFEGPVPVSAGAVSAPTWVIPSGTVPSVLTLQVAHPTTQAWAIYDRFTVSQAPPQVSLVAPVGGEFWKGPQTISWTGSSPQGYALTYSVLYSTDGGVTFAALATGLAGTSLAWNTAAYPASKLYVIRLAASDGFLTATATSGAFTVNNTSPTAIITQPAAGSTVSGAVTVTAAATGPVGVSKVDFYAGAALVGTVTAAPYSLVWDATMAANGALTLRASATDPVGLTGQSSIGVTVRNVGQVAGQVTDQVTGLPIAGAQMTLLQGATITAATALTGADGRYAFADALTGPYVVQAAASGYALATLGAVVAAGATQTANFALAPNPSTVTGLVTDAVTGLPLAGVTVQMTRRGVLVATGLTGADGRYSLSGLTEDVYVVLAAKGAYQTATQGLSVGAGQTLTANLALSPNPATVSGLVTDALTSALLAGATVSLATAGGMLVAQTLTPVAGTFAFTGVTPGSYTVTASRPGYGAAGLGAFPTAGGTVPLSFALQPLPGRLSGTVTDAQTGLALGGATVTAHNAAGAAAGAALTAAGGGYLIESLTPGPYTVNLSHNAYQTQAVGAVISPAATTTLDAALPPLPATLSGTILSDLTALPLAGAGVTLATDKGLPAATALSDAAGFYRVIGLAPGNYVATFQAVDHQTLGVGFHPGPAEVVTIDVTLKPTPGSISGTVTDAETSLPLSGAAVALSTSGGCLVATVTTDGFGRFTLPGLTPDPGYKLVASLVHYATQGVGAAVLPGVVTTEALSLPPLPASAAGTITDLLTGLPLAGVAVTVTDGASLVAGRALTGVDGRYLVGGLAPGRFTLAFHLPGYQDGLVGLQLGPEEAGLADLTLEPYPATVGGLVTDTVSGLPLPGVTAQLFDASGFQLGVTLTGPNGIYVVPGLKPGTYQLVFLLKDYGPAAVGVIAGPGATVDAPAGLTPSYGQARATVADAGTGLPLVGAQVTVSSGPALTVVTLVTDGSGQATTRLGPGSYQVLARQTLYAQTSVGATVAAGLTTDVAIALSLLNGAIQGTVISTESLVAVVGARVSLTDSLGVAAGSLYTDAAGAFTTGALRPGVYGLTVSAHLFGAATFSTAVAPDQTTVVGVRLTPLPATVTGVVRDAVSLAPLAGATVTLARHALLPVGTQLADNGGRYQFGGLPVSDYSLSCGAKGYRATVATFTVDTPGTTITVDQALPREPSAVTGTIRDAVSGLPLPGAGATVSLPDGTPVSTVLADGSGLYLAPGLDAVTYAVTATAFEHARRAGNASPGPGETVVLDFSLVPTVGALTGRVTDAVTGLPVAGAPVLVLTLDGSPLATAATGLDGSYDAAELPVGDLEVFFPATAGYETLIAAATIQAGLTTRLDVTLTPTPAAQAWPAAAEWTALIDTACAPLRAVSEDVTPLYLDITSAGAPGAIGAADSGLMFYRPATRTLFYRMLVSAIPLTPSGYRRGQWGVLIDSDGDGFGDWGALVTGIVSAGGAKVKVMYCPAGTHDNILRAETWSRPADPAAGFTRVALGPVSPTGRQTYYLDWQAPLDAFQSVAPDAPPPIGAKSCARFFFATGDTGTAFNKDFITGGGPRFDLIDAACLDVLPYGRFGRLVDIRDPDPPSDLGEWAPGETVVVTGAWWCRQASWLNVRVLDPSRAEVFRGTVPLTSGTAPPAPAWPIPAGTAPGLYALQVSDHPEDPTIITGWFTTDRFTVPHLPPLVALTSPVGGEAWRGVQTITWSASSPQGFPLTFALEYSTDAGATWLPLADGLLVPTYAWDTSTFPDSGRYRVRVTAADGTLSSSDTSPAVFTVENSAPAVSITSPAAGATVAGLVTFAATASDAVGVSGVQLLSSGKVLGTLTAAPYSLVWDTTAEPNGPASLRAVAVNAVGLSAQAVVAVSVRNAGAAAGTVSDLLTGAPVAGAAVDLLAAQSLPVATTTSGPDGGYDFLDQLTGSYLVRASAAGYGTSVLGAVVPPGAATIINLALTPEPASVTGLVLAAESGLPLDGATVRASHAGAFVGTATTDPSGLYLLSGLAEGTYVLTALTTDYQLLSLGLTLAPGQVATADFTLQPVPGTIRGTVSVAETGLPLSGAVVSLFDVGGWLVGQVATGPDGLFEFTSVGPGGYMVLGAAAGYGAVGKGAAPGPGGAVTVDFPLALLPGSVGGTVIDAGNGLLLAGVVVGVIDQNQLTAAKAMTDGAGQYAVQGLAPGSYQVAFSQSRYQSLTLGLTIPPGTAVFLDAALPPEPATIQGVVTSTDGPPLPGVAVQVLLNYTTLAAGAVTGPDGAYRVAGLAADAYLLIFQAAGFQSRCEGFVLTAAQTLTVSVALAPNSGVLEGTVLDADTALPLAGATARLADQADATVAVAQTGDQGYFLLGNLAPNPTYKLGLTKPGYGSLSLSEAVVAGATTTVTASLGALPGAVHGTLTAEDTGLPLPEGAVRVRDRGSLTVGTAVTGPAGQYRITGLSPGRYVVTFHVNGFGEKHNGLTLGAAEDAQVDMALGPLPGIVRGTITDTETGLPIGGVQVTLFETAGVINVFAVSGPDGVYTIANARRSTFTMTVVRNGYQPLQFGIRLEAGQTLTVDAALTPLAGLVDFLVTDAGSGLPLTGVMVWVIAGQSLTILTLFTAADGSAHAGLPEGHYIAMFETPGYAKAQSGLTITAGAVVDLAIALSPDIGYIQGLVLDSVSRVPVSDGHVCLFTSHGGPVSSLHTGPDGSFFSGSLRPDTYSISTETYNYTTSIVSATVTTGAITQVLVLLDPTPGTVNGTVDDAVSGLPVPSCAVTLYKQGAIQVGSRLTGPDGRYSFLTLPLGDYTVSYQATNYRSLVQSITIDTPGQTVTLSALLGLVPSGLRGRIVDRVTGLPVPQACLTISQVAAPLAAMTATEALATAAPGATLAAGGAPAVVPPAGTTVVTICADMDGRYVVPSLAPGSYVVSVGAPGYARTATATSPGPGETVTVDFDLTSVHGTVGGRVTDAVSGLPIGQLPISVKDSGGGSLAVTATDLDGYYRVPELPVAGIIVEFLAPIEYQGVSLPADIAADQTTTLDVALARTPGSLGGTVYDAATLLPLPGADVNVLTPEGAPVAHTLSGSGGLYAFSSLADGSYHLRGAKAGYGAASVPVVINPGRHTTADLRLEPLPGYVTGRVTDEETGRPLADVTVTVFDHEGRLIGRVFTNAAGRYRTMDLAAGEYQLAFYLAGYARASRPATVVSDHETVVDAALSPLFGWVEGYVTDVDTGRPLVATVTVFDAGGSVVAVTASGEDGRYRVDGLLGTYRFRFERAGYLATSRRATVVAGEGTRLDATLRPLSAVKVRYPKARLANVTGGLVTSGLAEVSADLFIELAYLPLGADEFFYLERCTFWDHVFKVPVTSPLATVKVEAVVGGVTARVRKSGVIRVIVTILVHAEVSGVPVDEKTATVVLIDPKEG